MSSLLSANMVNIIAFYVFFCSSFYVINFGLSLYVDDILLLTSVITFVIASEPPEQIVSCSVSGH